MFLADVKDHWQHFEHGSDIGVRGLGHQVGADFLSRMVTAAPGYGLTLPECELACAPIHSELGREYLGAMRAAINCALANRQILTHLGARCSPRCCPTCRTPLRARSMPDRCAGMRPAEHLAMAAN